jgi:hypothetical protein
MLTKQGKSLMSNDDKIGYRKPPQHSRFQKGKSGNPKGRPRGTKNFKTDLAEELSEQIVVTESGRTVRISKQRAVVKTLLARTLKGDARIVSTLMNVIVRFSDSEDQNDHKNSPLTEDENAALAVLEARLFGKVRDAFAMDDVPAGQYTEKKGDKS